MWRVLGFGVSDQHLSVLARPRCAASTATLLPRAPISGALNMKNKSNLFENPKPGAGAPSREERGKRFDRLCLGLCVLSLLVLLPGRLVGQGINPVVMHTGTGGSLSSQYFNYISGAGVSGLTIDFGFATAEQPQPGLIPDSFTISITGPNGTAYLVTVDTFGLHWEPFVLGSLPVPDSSIQRQTTPFLVPTESLPNLTSYVLSYALPANWQSVPLTVNFDLFDNQNNQASLAYFFVPVPEPGSGALLVLGLLFWPYRKQATGESRNARGDCG
jgi:hypothetical protein